MSFKLSVIFFLAIFCSCEPNEQKEESTDSELYKVIKIADGDTLEILKDGQALRVRLAHIDCPERYKNQPFSKKAKQALSTLCMNQEVKLSSFEDFDRHGRIIAEIYNKNGVNVNQEMVKLGMAWHFTRFSDDPEYMELQLNAQQNKIGLWADKNPIAPWVWRDSIKTQNQR